MPRLVLDGISQPGPAIHAALAEIQPPPIDFPRIHVLEQGQATVKHEPVDLDMPEADVCHGGAAPPCFI
jgi:hypothetical protein